MEHVRIVGWVDAVFFENPSNMYKVMRVMVDDESTEDYNQAEIVVTGQIASVEAETLYEFLGELVVHPKYGEQLQVIHYQQVAPSSREGLIEYLSSHRFKGVGKVLAERIVDKVGLDVIDQIYQDPSVLKGIPGLVAKTRQNLIEALNEHKGTEKLYIKLTEWGFNRSQSDKIVQAFGSDAIEKIKNNPYIMTQEIEGISFKKVDQLARDLDFEADCKERITAAIYTVVRDHCYQEGDTYLDMNQALHQARNILEEAQPVLIDNDPLIAGLKYAVFHEVIHHHKRGLMIPSISFAERSIAKCTRDLVKYSDMEYYEEDALAKAFDHVEKAIGIQYDADQQAALKTAINSPMTIITGGPGTGKTTLIKGLIMLYAYLNDLDMEDLQKPFAASDILLAAPTGRAAKRMTDTTGLPASTIHRLIGYTKETRVDQEVLDELDGKLLIVDEMSMVDTWLMNWLMRAIPYHMRVVFVGDRDQLPSVGPGQVFADFIDAGCLPTVVLKKIYRQAKDSSIISMAHQVRQGQLPQDFAEKLHDRTFIECRSNQIGQVVEKVVAAAHQKGFDTMNMQVLAPMYKGPAGINQMNTLLQDLLNPSKDKKRSMTHFDTVFRVGDKVIQLVNNTDEGIFNGDIGYIEGIYTEKETESKQAEMVVAFDDDREFTYQKKDLDQLTLAYCTSIHKAQGSEYDLVILPLVDLYSRLLRKDLLYTAITRAQTSLVMIGNPRSFQKAVSQVNTRRQTFLVTYLTEMFADNKQDMTVNRELSPNNISKSSESDSELGQEGNHLANPVSCKKSTSDNQLENTDMVNSQDSKSSVANWETTQSNMTHLDTKSASDTSNLHSSLSADSKIDMTQLNMDNSHLIDPMIGMKDIRPQDFMAG